MKNRLGVKMSKKWNVGAALLWFVVGGGMVLMACSGGRTNKNDVVEKVDTIGIDVPDGQYVNGLQRQVDSLLQGQRMTVGLSVVYRGNVLCKVNADRPFPLMSVFKLHQAMAVLDSIERSNADLHDKIRIEKRMLRENTYSPLRDKHPDGNIELSVAELLNYTLQLSDNNACDILFEKFGGPLHTDRFIQELGCRNTRIKWTEDDMHRDLNYCYENFTTPDDATLLLGKLAEDSLLLPQTRGWLHAAISECKTGTDRLAKPLMEKGVKVHHKTGTGDRNADGAIIAVNDIGFVSFPDGDYYSIAVFCRDSEETSQATADVIARISALVFDYVLDIKQSDEHMRLQADAFLKAMPADLQHRQAQAVRQAIDGNCSELENVRNLRNAEPQISETVRTKMLTPALRLYEPEEHKGEPLPLLVYFHGGGWTFGSLNSCARFCDAMAASGRMKVLAVDYRLAPEHAFPNGLEDCISAVGYAQTHAEELNIDAGKITAGGDSSGGNLAIATALSDDCAGAIESLLLFYPVTKAFADSSVSWEKYGKGYGLDAELMEAFNRAYAGEKHVRDTRVSVGLCSRGGLAKLPRTLLVAAGRDILCGQGEEFAAAAGNKVCWIEFPEAVHLFITVPGQDEAFHRAVRLATDFIGG